MKPNRYQWFFAGLFTILAVQCPKSFGQTRLGMNIDLEQDFIWEKSLSDAQKFSIQNDLSRLFEIQWDPSKLEGTAFERVWGKQPEKAIHRYLLKGVRVIAPLSKNESEILAGHFGAAIDQVQAVNYTKKFLLNGLFDLMEDFRRLGLGKVSNASVVETLTGRLLVSDRWLRGQIRVGPRYMDLAPGYEDRVFLRVGTWIHEARHSYCPASDDISVEHLSERKAIEEEIQDALQTGVDAAFRNSYPSLIRRVQDYQKKYAHIFAQESCGFDHVQCPMSHEAKELRELYGCEKRLAYGAYALEGIFLAGVGRACLNCTEAERQIALAASTERFSRVLDLESVLDNRLGDPSFEGL